MLDVLFVVFYTLFPLIVFLMLRFLNLSFFKITLPSMLILFMFIFAYVGILPLYFGWMRTSGTFEEKQLYMVVLFCASWTILGLLLGFSISKSVGLHIRGFVLQPSPLKKRDVLGLLFLFFVSTIILCLYINRVERVAMFTALRDGIGEAKVARSEMTNAFSGKLHWYRLFFSTILSFISYAFWSNWLITKKKIFFLFFSLAFTASSFAALMATQKAPFAFLMLGLYMTYILTRKKGCISKKSIALLLILLIIILPFMYIFFMGKMDWLDGLNSAFNRAITGQITPAAFYLEVFPHQIEFLLGQTFPNPGGIFPFVPFQSARVLMDMKYPHLQNTGIIGSMPTAFWGEAYINFGFWGVFFIPIIMGAWVWVLAKMIDKIPNTPTNIAINISLILHFKDLAFGNFSRFVVDFYLLAFLSIVFCTIFMSRLLFKVNIKYFPQK